MILQAIIVAFMITLACHRLGLRSTRQQLITILLLGTATSLGFFTATLLPDVFGGLALLALIILALFRSEMAKPEQALWFAAIVIFSMFHKAFLLVDLALLFVIFLLSFRKIVVPGMLPATIAVTLASAATLVTNPALERVVGVQIIDPPFLLARSIADGPAAQVLKNRCLSPVYVNCLVADSLPMTEEDYIWGNHIDPARKNPPNWLQMPPATREAMSKEQAAIMVEVFRSYPIWQLRESIRNFVRQFHTVDLMEFRPRPDVEAATIRWGYADEIARYRQGSVVSGGFPLAGLGAVWSLLYDLAILGVATLLLFRRRFLANIDQRLIITAMLLMVGLAINAAVNGMLSGVFGRYQGRVSWLAIFTLLLLAAKAVEMRRSTTA